jgi:hypothetical protein
MMRGRGTLEVRSSNNPYFQPVSADIGKNLQNSNVEWKVNGTSPQFASTKHTVDGNFAFLYTRESDRIGQKVPKPQLSETKMLSRTEFLKQRRERALASSGDVSRNDQDNDSPIESVPPTPASAEGATFRVDPEAYLRVYQHVPKEEDPRYFTSSNEIGRKPPTIATIVNERYTTQQNFSKSFNNAKPKNTSLTTALTRSNVHKALDPQFA